MLNRYSLFKKQRNMNISYNTIIYNAQKQRKRITNVHY